MVVLDFGRRRLLWLRFFVLRHDNGGVDNVQAGNGQNTITAVIAQQVHYIAKIISHQISAYLR